MTGGLLYRCRNIKVGVKWRIMAGDAEKQASRAVTPEMMKAGLRAYREFLGDDCPVISDEKALIVQIYNAMETQKTKTKNSARQPTTILHPA
jgi:hypothetical protein